MNYPWVEVLDYACDWAQGETSVTGAATAVAAGVYDMDDTNSNIEFHLSSDYIDIDGFYLSDFLYDIQNSGNVYVNCYDCSNLFCIFSRAIGCGSQTKKGEGNITTWPIYLIGAGDAFSEDFGSHQFGVIGNYVYDASLVFYGLYYPHDPVYPYNMGFGTYTSGLIQSGSMTYDAPETPTIAN